MFQKIFFWVFFIPSILYTLREAQDKYAGRIRLNLDDINLPRYVHTIPGRRHNLRSAQLSLNQLDSLIDLGYIQNIIRLNGDGKAAAGVPIAKERTLCDSLGIGFIYINPEATDAALTIHALLLDGRTLIHCRHGFDRTGAMVGYHLRQLGYSRQQVIQHNGWEGYVEKKGNAYRKYLSFIK